MDVISSLTAGTILGLSAGLSPGPLLAFVITQTLRHNTSEGVKAAMAPFITDIPIIIVSLFVLTRLADLQWVLGTICLLGGLYVLYLAYEALFAGPVNPALPREQPHSVKKGAIVNALSPHPYVFWMTVGAPIVVKAQPYGPVAPLAFLGSFYAFLVGSKIVLAVAVGKSRNFLGSKGYLVFMRILGGSLAVFAFLLLKNALHLLKTVF